MKNPSIRESRNTLLQLTDPDAERNIYVHPVALARDIFWQRLEILLEGLKPFAKSKRKAIDFGGGSGAFLKGLCSIFESVEVVDLDPQDAHHMRAHQGLQNATIIQTDISAWNPETPRDAVIATDVLEHFQDLDVPIARIKEYLAPRGILAISVPTENWIYLLGRVLVNKTKPKDHYHAGGDIVKKLQASGFELLWEKKAPNYFGIPIPLFHLAIFKKNI